MNATLSLVTVAILAALAGPAQASIIHYTINFTVETGSPTPSGSFDYDPTVGFSNLIVSWDGELFDLTGSANAPGVGGTCTSSYQNLFLAISGGSACQSQTTIEWSAETYNNFSSFSLGNNTLPNYIFAHN